MCGGPATAFLAPRRTNNVGCGAGFITPPVVRALVPALVFDNPRDLRMARNSSIPPPPHSPSQSWLSASRHTMGLRAGGLSETCPTGCKRALGVGAGGRSTRCRVLGGLGVSKERALGARGVAGSWVVSG